MPDTARPCRVATCDDYDPRATGWCVVHHPYSPEMLRGTRTTDGYLWQWGVDVAHGYWRAAPGFDPDRPRIGKAFGPRAPAVDRHLLLSEAFARLSDSTAGLGADGALGWIAHLPLNAHQEVIHAYYVLGLGTVGWGRGRELTAEDREYLLRHETVNPVVYRRQVVVTVDETSYGDRAVAVALQARAGWRMASRQTVNRWRNEAIRRMARSCGWPG